LFENVPKIAEKLQTLVDVGLEYLKLGQPSPTLSGGEAQRIKLSRELSKKETGKTLYVLDEPTTGLHFADIEMLLKVIHGLADRGNTVVIVEHNMDVIKTADYVIDLGPHGGAGGGTVVACGRPADVAKNLDSFTGAALAKALKIRRRKPTKKHATATTSTHRIAPPPDRARTHLIVEAAAEHNLKSVSVELPRDAMTVFCGPSGSGKSSLAMDTIYAEGQRRYVESLSSYARQFIGQVQKPHVERIEGLSPAVALEQKNLGHSPRSTVGTVTEVFDYLRILMARLGTRHCPDCGIEVGTQTPDQITQKILAMPEATRALLLAPIDVVAGEASADTWQSLRSQGYNRVRIDGVTHPLDDAPTLDPRRRQEVQVVVDRITINPDERSRISDSVEQALSLGIGVLQLAIAESDRDEKHWETITHSQHLVCGCCGRSFPTLTPHHFSFNSAVGWCPQCEGLGVQTGTNPNALLDSPQKTLAEGASLLWPDVDASVSMWLLRALSRETGIPTDVPMDQMTATHRRMLFHGLGERWIEVRQCDAKPESKSNAKLFRYQFKGFYPALEEAARLTPGLRGKLEQFVDEINCSACDGSRLREEAAACRFRGLTIADLVHMPLDRLDGVVSGWKLDRRESKIAGELMREIRSRVRFLLDVGLNYLTLHRGAATLSGGEAQRIRLASQLGSGLCGVLYVLDEPTIGLHPRDNLRLLSALHRLRDLGNTLLVVEHDRDVIGGSDYLCDFGPRAGRHGGRIVARGNPHRIDPLDQSVTAGYINGSRQIAVPKTRRPVYTAGGQPMAEFIHLYGASENNLANVDLKLPLGVMTVVTGPSGSGKSSLIEGTLYPILGKRLHRVRVKPGRHDRVEGLRHIDKVIQVDQSPLGNTPSSNPATYTGVFDLIRNLFASLPEAGERRFTARTFSFNVPGGRCETCEGSGQRRIEMHFLPDVWVPCEECGSRRYNEDVLQVKYHGQSIADVLEMPAGDAVELFASDPRITRILQTLCDVGLDYVTLGQAAPTLSGGEAQRVKLAAELARPGTGNTLYLLDEPTTGLHFDDIAKLLDVIQRLVDLGNTAVVIEHNLDVIKSADWIIDMGPGAGADGGRIVFEGTPEQLAETAATADPALMSSTAPFVADALNPSSPKTTGGKDAGTGERATADAVAETTASLRIDTASKDGKRRGRKAAAPKQSTAKTPAGTAAATSAKKRSKPLRDQSSAVWETLGRRWHSMPKGFDDNATPAWPLKLPERLFQQIEKIGGEDCLRMAAADRVDVVGDDGKIKLSIRTRDLDAVKLVAKRAATSEEINALDEAKIEVTCKKTTTTLSLRLLGQAAKPALKRFLKHSLTG
jgi:excinuclease ABC subunit A